MIPVVVRRRVRAGEDVSKVLGVGFEVSYKLLAN